MIELDVTDPDQVTSPKRLMVVTGEPGVQLHIFTGIAMTRMYNQDDAGIFGTTSHDRSEHIRVDLGQLAGQMLDFTAQVSLSRIWSYPTLFNLHLTDVWMEHIPGGTLILHSDAQMNGTAGLVAMSYQANIKTREFLAEISGIVRWGSELAATRDADLLEVTGQASQSLTGMIAGAPSRSGDWTQVPFLITNPPLGEQVLVDVSPRAGAFEAGGQPTSAILATQAAGPRPVILTATNPIRSDLIFELRELG